MRLSILCDANWESGIEKILGELADRHLFEHFEAREYGAGLGGVTVIFMCRDPSYDFKRRVKLSKKESKIYLDIMLNSREMSAATPEMRKREVAQRLYDEIPEVLSRYKIVSFDGERFVADLRSWIDELGWR
jgi:hypothetical protein